jgi:microsomal dipeptidase-like Zn-dependent dipeptidase
MVSTPGTVVGYADLHVHHFTNESMAGAWLYGSPTGPQATALARCNGNVPLAPGRNHGTFDSPLVAIIGGAVGVALIEAVMDTMGGDTGLHAGRRHGFCQANNTPGPGLCRGNVACNLLSQGDCASPGGVCEWRSIGSLCRDKPGDGISRGAACNLVASGNCGNTCYWDKIWGCRGNVACNGLSKANCQSSVCEMQSIGSICRDKDGDGKSVGLACNTLGQAACTSACTWDPTWGSITLHAEDRAHDWTDRHDGDKAAWPAWDVTAHQQVHMDWLRQAYQDGLRLMVMSALNNEAFCAFLPAANRAPGYGCGDLENVTRQLKAAIAVAADPATSWYQIAYSAADARKIIGQNKLAVILSVEASDIFNPGDPLGTLQALYKGGVRTLQPLHQFNSKLGGVAWHERMIMITQTIKNLPSVQHLCKTAGGTGTFAACDAETGSLNYLGLTPAGRRFVTRMLNLGMPVDISHMSERSVRDVEPIVTAACNYPVYVSHGQVRTLLDDDSWKANKHHEKTIPDWQLDLIKKTGGMMGLRTGSDHHDASAYQAAISAAALTTSLPSRGPVAMNGKAKLRGGSEFHFAYALDYLHRVKGVSVALGSDLNGLIPQMVFDGEPHDGKLAGLAHVGKLPTLFTKLRATGLNTDTYNQLKQNSADAYVKMWERAEAFAGGKSCCPAPTVTSVTPGQGWFGRANRVSVNGTNFTPHSSMQVTLRAAGTTTERPCTDVEFVSGTQMRCTLPALTAGVKYDVTVRNGGCGLSATLPGAYEAAAVDRGPTPLPAEPIFNVSELRTALADEVRLAPRIDGATGRLREAAEVRLVPNASKLAAVDWNHPAWGGASVPTRNVPIDRPLEDGYPQRDWEAASTIPGRSALSPALEVLMRNEDSASITDALTMIAACDKNDAARAALAASNRWPADWRAQMRSLCNWQELYRP